MLRATSSATRYKQWPSMGGRRVKNRSLQDFRKWHERAIPAGEVHVIAAAAAATAAAVVVG